jgi:hypothetical protein
VAYRTNRIFVKFKNHYCLWGMSEKTQIACNGLMPLETLKRLATSYKSLSQRFQGLSRCLKASQDSGPVPNSLKATQGTQAEAVYGRLQML